MKAKAGACGNIGKSQAREGVRFRCLPLGVSRMPRSKRGWDLTSTEDFLPGSSFEAADAREIQTRSCICMVYGRTDTEEYWEG